ncbi:MAG: starch-binding protein, partial [Ruminococcus sp.]|nr:starch-binding protein [Ruminococcus sp.]
EVEDITEDDGTITEYPKADFDFILELDTAENAANAGDMTFTTTRGQVMTHKVPDEPATEQVEFMKAKYQAVEDALYGGDIATLETLVDLDDFARAYLVNEVAKNLDAGVTSCYFTYNSETGKFTTAPVWDYDNALGNSVSIAGRHDANGTMLDVTGPSGWYARDLMHYDLDVLNVFGQACATTATNAAGETFNDVVLRIWNDEFMPALAVLEGTATAANGRFNSVAGYLANLAESGQWNYDYAGWDLTANNGWVADHSSLTMYDYDAEANTYTTSTKSYDQYTLDGQANYAGDWMISRMNWMAAQYAEAELDVPDGYITIYFENNWQWPDAKVYYWGSTIGTNPEWNGISLTNVVGQNDQGYDIYEIVIPEDITGLLFNGTGEYGAEQSADIKSGWYEGICYYMTYDSATNTKPCGSYDYKVPAETTSAPAEEAETITIYFENNWAWPDAKIYYWGSTTGENPAWEGIALTNVVGQNDAGYDIYEIVIPADITGIIFNGTGEYGFEQSADITEGWYDGICYYMTYDSATNTKPCGTYDYNVPEETTTATATVDESDPAETTTAPAETTAPASGDEPDMPTVITVYAINSAKWEEVYAYCWADSEAVAWPGVAMEKTEDTVNGFDVYALSFDSAYVNVIFNNNNKGAQTADLTAKDGQYYDIKGAAWYASLEEVPALDTLSTDRYIVGEFNGWSTTANEFKLKAEGESYGYVTLTLEANTTYEFKVIREGAWTSCTTPVTGTVTGLQFSSSNADNCTITTTDAGEYVFAFGLNDSKLNVTYPGSEVITPTTPDEEETDTTVKLAGDFTEWGTNAIEMTADENGTVYTTELYLEANTYEFKMIEFGKWLGNNGSIENTCEGWTFRNGTDENGNEYGNCTLVATGGTYTFTFDTTTDKLTITAVLDEIPATVYDVNWPVDNGLYTVNAPATADEGSVIEFTVDAVEGYTVAGVIVNMEEVYADENGVYTWTVTENVNIMAVVIDGSITPDEPTEYNVYAPESEYYTVNAPATVEANGTLTFTIDVADDYVIDYVIVNMVEVYANEANEYVFEDVTEDVEILVYVSEDTSDDTPIVTPEKYTVMFVDYDNTILAVAKVEAGTNLPAPEAPTRAGYTFTGWSQATDNVVKDMIVVAQYKKIEVPVEPATIGRLQVEVSGGTGVTVNGRPQGTSYLNTKMTIGTSVTLVAKASSDATFVGWLNASNNLIITTDTTYTFTATGNDSYKALYLNDVEGVNVVRFMNDKSKQILDMQYYAAGETIVYPEYPTQAGFQATGWNMTDAQIQAQLEAGNDVTVSPTWERVKVYVNVSANGGTLSNGNGSYLLTGYVTATANAPETGMKFAYWVDQDNNVKSYDAEYSFFAVKDTELTAVYVAEDEEIEYKILVNVDAIDTVTYDTTNATYYSWYVPTTQMGIKYVKNGVISVNKKNYNEATFVAGSTDSNVYDRGPTGTEAVPVGSRSWTKSNVAVGDTWMSRAYVQYTIDGDPTGTVYTVYSDIVEATRY